MTASAWLLSLTGCLLFGVQSWLWAYTEKPLGGKGTIAYQAFGSVALNAVVWGWLLAGPRDAAGPVALWAAPRWLYWCAALAGACGVAGALCYVLAVGGEDMRVHTVLAVTAAYPLVTLLIRLGLQHKLPDVREVLGFFMLVVGVILISWKKTP